MKFEEAFSNFDNGLYSVDEVFGLFSNALQEFNVKYKSSFVCPKCHRAQLSYNNASTPYFKAYPHAAHEDNCDLKQDEMSTRAAERFIKGPDSSALIQRQMASILNGLFPATSSPTSEIQPPVSEKPTPAVTTLSKIASENVLDARELTFQ